jgi:hypothetical protein
VKLTDGLVELARSKLVVEAKLQELLDHLVPPTTTGYLHSKESWTIGWIRPGEHEVDVEIAIDPPEGLYSWRRATVARLQVLQEQLGCDHISALAMGSGQVRYIAAWNRKVEQ